MVDMNQALGGYWLNGVHDEAHVLTCKAWFQFKEYPMPDDYPECPSKNQVLAYLHAYAAYWSILSKMTFRTEVKSVEKLESNGELPHVMQSSPFS